MSELQVAYSEEEEMRMIVDGYQRLMDENDSLSNYGLPDGCLFVRTVNKLKGREVDVHSSTLVTQLQQLNEMIKEAPDDPILRYIHTRYIL